ncbi:MAG TPA: hypothetical protein VF648_07155 [Pyrinomonadaceae bacterium]|jgi:hypothetical protein
MKNRCFTCRKTPEKYSYHLDIDSKTTVYQCHKCSDSIEHDFLKRHKAIGALIFSQNWQWKEMCLIRTLARCDYIESKLLERLTISEHTHFKIILNAAYEQAARYRQSCKRALVVRAILENYLETRSSSSHPIVDEIMISMES